MYYWLNYLLQNMTSLYCLVTIAFCLTPKYPRLRSIAVCSISSAAILLLKFTNFNHPARLSAASLLLQLALFVFILVAFRDSIYRKLVVFAFIISCGYLAELIGLIYLNSKSHYSLALEPHRMEFTIALLFILPIHFLLNLIFLFIWNYVNKQNRNYLLLVFSIFPMLQLLISAIGFMPYLFEQNRLNSSLIFICAFIASVTIVILLYLLLHRQEKQAIQIAYQELQELYQMESEYYQALEARHEELSKIRHDYNNQISTLYMLISSNQLEAARELANSMKQQLK